MTARTKEAVVRVVERIPHKDVAYAYLELEASNVNEFQSLRAEALASEGLAHYAFAAKAPAQPTVDATDMKATVKAAMAAAKKKGADVGAAAAGPEVGPAEEPDPEPDTAPAPSTEGMSPREIARARLLAKKEAK